MKQQYNVQHVPYRWIVFYACLPSQGSLCQRYVVGVCLGEGVMGVVYFADTSCKRETDLSKGLISCSGG